MIRAAILDVDGTLIDSNHAHASSWVEAFAHEGIEAEYSEVRSKIGKGGDRLVPEVSGYKEEEGKGKKIADYRSKLFEQKYLPKLKPFPNVRELLLALKSQGLKLVVASSSGKDHLDKLLEKAGIADLIDETTSKDDADSSKPAPDIIEAAMDRAGIQPDEAFMLGDTPYDIQAAARAGVRTIALKCGGWSEEALAGAMKVFDSPKDMLEHLNEIELQ